MKEKAQDPNVTQAADAAIIGQNNEAAQAGLPLGAGPGLTELTPEQHEQKAALAAVHGSGLYHLNVLFNAKVKGKDRLDQVANGVANLISKAEHFANWTAKEVEELWDKVAAELEAAVTEK